MNKDFIAFEKFAKDRLLTTAFETSADSESSHIFHSSLESAKYQFQWTHGAKNPRGEEFHLVAGFLDTFSPNALADHFEGSYFIGINIALFVAINEFALFCFAQRDFFPEVGDPTKETSPAPWDDRVPGLWLIDNTAKGGGVENRHSSYLIPKDPERYIMSQYLSFLMTRFVWLHELAHCFNGHVDFVQRHGLALRLNELPAVQRRSQEQDKAYASTFQCLEFDADQSAFWANCNIQLRGLENIEGIRELDTALRLRLALFGSYAMTWLFEQFQNYASTLNEDTHPRPLERLQFLFKTAREKLLTLHPEVAEHNFYAIGQFDKVRLRIPVMYGSDYLLEMFSSPSINANAAQLHAKRLRILKELEMFQYSSET
tara:strand:- start:14891 stop:16009 length:1119 start_codon:yes stop_codon:yes gene_type:complete